MRNLYDALYIVRQVSVIVGFGAIIFAAFTMYQNQSKANKLLDTHLRDSSVTPNNNVPLTEKLSLEKRLIGASDKTKSNGTKVNSHVVAFGNWMSDCSFTQTSSNSYASCTVQPFNGNAEYKSHLDLTYSARPRVRYQDKRDARIDLVTPSRLRGSDIGIKCADFISKGPENKSKNHTFVSDEAERLVSRMKLSKCTLSYFARRSEDVVENTFLSHGFSKANSYAKQYARSPKRIG